MTEQERLEEIKGVVSTWITILSEGDFPDITSEEVELVQELIQQAERVKKLEEYNELAYNRIVKVEEQNQRYKQALEFYADKKTYDNAKSGPLAYAFRPIEADSGEKARLALKGDSNA